MTAQKSKTPDPFGFPRRRFILERKTKAMLMRQTLLRCVLLLLCAACFSCQLDREAPAPGTAIYNYDWGFVNLSTETDVDEVVLYLVRNGELVYLARGGHMVFPGHGRNQIYVSGIQANPLIVPNVVVIKWSKNDGVQRWQTVSLDGVVPSHGGDFKGTIWLRFYDDQWHPIAFTQEQMRQRGVRGQSYTPARD